MTLYMLSNLSTAFSLLESKKAKKKISYILHMKEFNENIISEQLIFFQFWDQCRNAGLYGWDFESSTSRLVE